MSDETEEEIEDDFKRMPYAKIIEQKVLDFLKENISHLPMYAHPLLVRDILRNFDNSPMFTWSKWKKQISIYMFVIIYL